VFFRLFSTAVTDLSYNDTTLYPRVGNGAAAVAVQGTAHGEVASIPFFASPRTTNPGTQPDPTNVATLHGADATEVVTYFGCWLDFNHLPAIRNLIRGPHQCMVAEIHFPPGGPIPPGATPANNDQLSQRNLAIVASDNPGVPAAHTVAHTFELIRSQTLAPLQAPILVRAFSRVDYPPDQLFIRWRNLPLDAVATVYLPGADMSAMLEAAAITTPGAGTMALVDQHTIRFRTGDTSYLPIPGGPGPNLAGLLTVELPTTVRNGQRYRLSVHQVSGPLRTIIGSFDMTIPVSTAAQLLPVERRDLIVLREIAATIPAANRWSPVFTRYLGILADRVRALGGEPDQPDHPEEDHEAGNAITGKVLRICYDCFGDFEGFAIATCNGEHHFRSREHGIHDVIWKANVNRLPVTVTPNPHAPAQPHTICVNRR
jgi:hypothetical protein